MYVHVAIYIQSNFICIHSTTCICIGSITISIYICSTTCICIVSEYIWIYVYILVWGHIYSKDSDEVCIMALVSLYEGSMKAQ